MAAPSMENLAREFAPEKIGSIFLYTHEAHPGENLPHHTSFDQKIRHATLFMQEQNIQRSILVDALDGACHRVYGGMPNMTWIISRTGTPVYKSDWTDTYSVEMAIRYLLATRDRRRAGERLAPFRVERLDYRLQDQDAFYRGLARSGPKAVEEFKNEFG
jgi:hypothetical protein